MRFQKAEDVIAIIEQRKIEAMDLTILSSIWHHLEIRRIVYEAFISPERMARAARQMISVVSCRQPATR